MKKLSITILLLLVTTLAFAQVQLYEFVDAQGNVVGITYSDKNGSIFPPVSTTAVEITESQKAGELAKQQAYQQSLIPTPINQDALMQGIFGIFQNNLATLGQYAGTIQLLIQYKNWVGISALKAQLISAGTLTQDQANQVVALFAAQGITLP